MKIRTGYASGQAAVVNYDGQERAIKERATRFVPATLEDAVMSGYYPGADYWQMGYVSRKVDEDDQPVLVAAGKRHGQLFVLLPAWRTTNFCVRQYLHPPKYSKDVMDIIDEFSGYMDLLGWCVRRVVKVTAGWEITVESDGRRETVTMSLDEMAWYPSNGSFDLPF